MKNYNFLYCFDEGYNTQTLASIYSVSKNIKNGNISIYILHKNPETFESFAQKIKGFNNIDKVKIFKFEKDLSNYPNLKDSHVSEATYYRLFISEYISEEVDHLIYLDSDVFCINNPEYILNYKINELLNSSYTISVTTELFKNSINQEIFNKLNLKNEKYFNAGVMLIDYKKWTNLINIEKLLILLDELKNEIDNWDQDLLNKVFDGNYLELTNFLNFRINSHVKRIFYQNSSFFIHFAGNHKPWTIEGALDDGSSIYFELLNELGIKPYNIKLKSRKFKSFIKLLSYIFTLKILKTNSPYHLLVQMFKAVIRI